MARDKRIAGCISFLLSSFAGPSISSTMWFRLIIKLIGWDRATGESSSPRPQQRAGAGGGEGGGGTREGTGHSTLCKLMLNKLSDAQQPRLYYTVLAVIYSISSKSWALRAHLNIVLLFWYLISLCLFHSSGTKYIGIFLNASVRA